MSLDEAVLRLQRAKDHYQHALAQIDRLMKPILAVDPSALDAVKALQATYREINYAPLQFDDAEQQVTRSTSKRK